MVEWHEIDSADTEEIVMVFEPPTQELSAFDVGVEATLAAFLLEMIARGMHDAWAADIVTGTRERIYGGQS